MFKKNSLTEEEKELVRRVIEIDDPIHTLRHPYPSDEELENFRKEEIQKMLDKQKTNDKKNKELLKCLEKQRKKRE